jgi:hypothetical protein
MLTRVGVTSGAGPGRVGIGRGFFRSLVSILDLPSGAVPMMVDLHQFGGSPDNFVTSQNDLDSRV